MRQIFNYDLLARFGGDEFCILLKGIQEETLEDRLACTYGRATESDILLGRLCR